MMLMAMGFVTFLKLTVVQMIQLVTTMKLLQTTMVIVHMLKLRTIVLAFVLMILMEMVFVMNLRVQVVQILRLVTSIHSRL